jgi:hypothetical protein
LHACEGRGGGNYWIIGGACTSPKLRAAGRRRGEKNESAGRPPIFFEGDGKTTNPVLAKFKNYPT